MKRDGGCVRRTAAIGEAECGDREEDAKGQPRLVPRSSSPHPVTFPLPLPTGPVVSLKLTHCHRAIVILMTGRPC